MNEWIDGGGGGGASLFSKLVGNCLFIFQLKIDDEKSSKWHKTGKDKIVTNFVKFVSQIKSRYFSVIALKKKGHKQHYDIVRIHDI